VIDGHNAGKDYFFEVEATIGRVESNSLVLVDPGISRTHARVFEDHGVYFLEDAGSANGTRLNGEKVPEAEVLKDRDYITVGQTTMQFSLLSGVRGEITAERMISTQEARIADQRPMSGRGASGPGGFFTSRRGILLTTLIVLAGLVGWLILRSKKQILVFDQSSTPIIYSDDSEVFNAVFGYGRYDQTHLNQLQIHFEYFGGRATLQYGAWGVDKTGEVALELNGSTVGQVPLTMNRWSYGLKLVLPKDKLKKGQKNELVFRNTLNPKAKESWEICYLQILQEAIPPPDPKEARFQFDLAKKAWEDREIEPSNMYTALLSFKNARDLLEGLPSTRPEIYQEALDLIDTIDAALTKKFADGLFSARRAAKVDNDPEKARTILQTTLSFFRKEDFRHREIQRYLDSLSEK